jgi:hypothetical protein
MSSYVDSGDLARVPNLHSGFIMSGVYLPAPFRVAVSTVLDIYRWLEAPI